MTTTTPLLSPGRLFGYLMKVGLGVAVVAALSPALRPERSILAAYSAQNAGPQVDLMPTGSLPGKVVPATGAAPLAAPKVAAAAVPAARPAATVPAARPIAAAVAAPAPVDQMARLLASVAMNDAPLPAAPAALPARKPKTP